MHTFRDTEGREWAITLTIGSAKRVRDLVNVDLLTPESPHRDREQPLLTQLDTDILLLCDVIYALCQPQAEQRGLTDEQFAAGLGGESILQAHDALFAEMAGFFQQAGRSHLVRMIDKQRAIVAAGIRAVETKVNAVDIDALVEQAVSGGTSGGGDGDSSTDSRASPVSIPAT